MSTYRLAILGVLAVVAAFYGYYLLQQAQQPTVPPKAHAIIAAEVLPGGDAVSIDGQRFDDPAKLKAKLAEIRKQHPGAAIALRGADFTKPDQLKQTIALFHDSGETGITFITDPHRANAPAPAAQ